ncbi:condensin-2 complex subunit D3-like [Asterias rubens]|uniref:condensin-2 complex subunit D3-like n=1 Tax=Asterias rubens TaxID=7604 RepID=UPI001455158F|nr:condensin-2 complex subunit D3-like [Asterias rubens]
MADPAQMTNALQRLRFSELEKQWVDAVWEQDFTEKPELPQSLAQEITDNRGYVRILKDAIKSCVPWARIDFATLPQGFWSVLSDAGLSPRSLLALLHYFMCGVDRVISSAIQRETAILAADLYFVLNEIPGSGAYKIFHPLVFQEAVDLLKQWPDSVSAKRKRNASGPPSSNQASQGRRGNKSRRVDDGEGSADAIVPFDEDEDNEDEINALTPQEVTRIKSAVMGTLMDFIHLLRASSFKDAEQSTQHAMQVMSELTRVTGDQTEVEIFDSKLNPEACSSVGHLSYLGLAALCSTSHGHVTDMFTLVLKHLMPNILMLIGENGNVAMATIPRTIQIIKSNTIAFIKRMKNDLEDEAIPSLRLLLQHLCVKVPDKAEYRAKTAETVALILTYMPINHRAKFIEWLYKYSRNVKIGHRVFALEVVAVLLETPQDQQDAAAATAGATAAAPAASQQQFLSPTFLTQLLLSRCSDRAPTVRAKALTCFADFTTSTDPSIQQALNALFFSPSSGTTPVPLLNTLTAANPQSCPATPECNNQDNQPEPTADSRIGETEEAQDGATPGNLMGGSPALLLEMSNGSSSVTVGRNIICMLQKRARDEKVGVRKAALQALENILRLDGSTITIKELQVLHDACLDPALSVRKQAVASLTTLLGEKKTCVPLQKVWLQSILPGVLDREVSAQEKCLQLLKEILLDSITARNHGDDDASRLSWNLLGILSQDGSGDLRRYLQKACSLWAKQKALSNSLVRAVTSHINHDNNQAAWLLLAEVAPCCPTFDPKVITQAWGQYKSADGSVPLTTLQRVLSVMGSLAGRFDDDVRQEMIGDLKGKLMAFDSSPELSSSMISTLNKLCLAVDGTTDRNSTLMSSITDELLQRCSVYLSRMILEDGSSQMAICESTLVRYLGILGEVACLCPARMSRRMFMLVQSLLAGPTKLEGDSFPGSQAMISSQTQPPLSQFGNTVLSDTVRAHVFITLGKLCLVHETLAKQCIAALSRELETSTNPAVRNNVAVIMCDLCIRYPSVVDCHISNLSMCFKDESELVRKQSLTLLTHLLLEDYIKWRGSLFFHFITSLVDDVKEIRDFAEFCLVQLLLKRHPNMLFHHFIESVFHFNAYDKHNVYNQFSQTEREKKLFSLKGAPNADKRRTIYRFMLQHMNDEHRFKLTAKLSQEVLAGIVDGVLPLDEDTNILLQDTLDILCCKEIKLASLRSKAPTDIDDRMEMAEAVINQAKTKLITQVVKQNMIENIVPIVIALKHNLEKARSPTLRHLMLYLKQLMKDYRNEVKDILAADRQLATEIEFDLRRFDEEQIEAAKKQKAASIAVASPRPGSKPTTPVASPRNTPVAQALLSPRSVSNCSPRIIRTPRPGVVDTPPATTKVPDGADVYDFPATPIRNNRPISLAAQAIVNSARRAIASAKRLTPIKSTSRPQHEVRGHDLQSKERSPLKESTQENQSKTPTRPSLRGRAISTPDQTIANITFHAPMDLSVIPPPSPTPSSLPVRVFSDEDPKKIQGTPSWNPQLQIENRRDLLMMLSPDQPTPKPRTWNITSPKPRPQAKSRTKSIPTDPATIRNDGEREGQAQKRKTRASTSILNQSKDTSDGQRGTRTRRSSRSTQK